MKSVIKILGWRNWAVFTYNSFIEHIFLVFFIALSQQDFSLQFLMKLLVFYLFSIFSTSFGYLINDLADRELDIVHGKPNVFKSTNPSLAALTVFSVFILSVICTIPFWKSKYFLSIWLLWLLCAGAYSLKPFRLKEKGTAGLWVVVLAQRVLPTLLVFSAFNYFSFNDVVLFTLYILFRGLASDINHQIEDYNRDVQTSTQTFAVKGGYHRALKWLWTVLEIEKVLFFFVLIRISFRISQVYGGYYNLIWLIVGVYLPLYLISLRKIQKGENRNPFIANRKSIFQFIHHPLPTIILPFILGIFLISFNRWYFVVLMVLGVNKKLWSFSTIRNSFPFQVMQKFLSR